MPTQQELRRRLQGGSSPSVTIAGVRYGPEEIPEAFGIWNPQQTGGIGDIEPTPIPQSSPSPTAAPTATATPRGDNSNAGLVNRTLFDNQANTDWWSTGGAGETLTASAGVTRTLDGFGAGLQGAYPFGEPTVQVPTSDATYPLNLDNAPSLFGSGTGSNVNPFDEWWRRGEPMITGEASGSAGIDLSGAGGSMWAELPPLQTESGSANLASTNDSPVSQENPNFNPIDEGTGLAVEPDALNQDYEWTTSPGDRRFLNTPPGADELTPAGDDPNTGRVSVGGTSMSGFGGNLSLGSNLNTPFELMNYGGGYPQGEVQRGDGLMTGAISFGGATEYTEGENLGGREPGTNWGTMTPAEIEAWQENARSNTSGQGSGRSDGTGTTTIQIPTQQGGLAGLTIVGHDTRNGQPIYRDSRGSLFVNPGTGTRISPGVAAAVGRDYESAYGQSALSRASLSFMQMAQSNPTQIIRMSGATGDAGRTSFDPRRGVANIAFDNGAIIRQPGGPYLPHGSRRGDVLEEPASARNPNSGGGRGRG